MLTPYDLMRQARERAGLKAREFANRLLGEGVHLEMVGDHDGAVAKWNEAARQLDLANAYDGQGEVA